MLQIKNKKTEFLFYVMIFISKKIQSQRKNSAINTITQDMRFRLSLIRYAQKHGASNAAKNTN